MRRFIFDINVQPLKGNFFTKPVVLTWKQQV